MGKSANKQSKRDQVNGKDTKKGLKTNVVEGKVAQPAKEKGPQPPSYTPNTTQVERRQAQLRQDFARKVNEAQTFFPAFTAGVHGEYLVGYSAAGNIEAHYFDVKEIVLPALGDKSEKKFLAIQEVRDDGRKVFIPHEWLFFSADDRFYASGPIGKIQYGMLCFLQRTLCAEIKSIKRRRWEEREAVEKAKAEEDRTKALAERAEQIASSENVIPIQDAILERGCRPVTDLVKNDCLGLYNLSDEKGMLVTELRAGKGGNIFVVKKITEDHHLSHFLKEGCVIGVNNVRLEAPEFNQHVRELLALHGIILNTVKPRHDKRDYVTEGLPNFHEETLLVA